MRTPVRLRAPQNSGTSLLVPSFSQMQREFVENRNRTSGTEQLAAELGWDIAALRRRVVRMAEDYTKASWPSELPQPEKFFSREVPANGPGNLILQSDSSRSEVGGELLPIVLSGHQPELFHPGVWFKNFVLHELASRLQATPLNLIIDNDLASPPKVWIPWQVGDNVVHQSVAFDAPAPEVPYEFRRIRDRQLWDSFPDRLGQAARGWVAQPLVTQVWPAAESLRSDCLGWELARLRHRVEFAAGLRTWELPWSRVCQLPEFGAFVLQLCRQRQRFVQVYNRELANYRWRQGIRNHGHPVPDLETDEDFYEMPFWVADSRNSQRRRLFVKALVVRGTEERAWELTDRQGWSRVWRIEDSLDQWEAWATEGVAIRTRALTTTLFARLFVGDYFLHGIGGAKYDEVTDAIMEGFWGIKPPAYGTVTATYKIPHPTGRSWRTADEGAQLQRELRELRYHPERFLTFDSVVERELAQRRRQLWEQKPPRGAAASWHREMLGLHRALQAISRDKLRVAEQARSKWEREWPQDKIWGSREFSWVCFPASLPTQLKDLAREATKS